MSVVSLRPLIGLKVVLKDDKMRLRYVVDSIRLGPSNPIIPRDIHRPDLTIRPQCDE